MFRFAGATFFFLASHLAICAVSPLVCPAGAPIGSVDLRVRAPNGGTPLPLKTINRLEEGETILYRPIVRPSETRKGEVAIVLVSAVHHADQDNLTVLEPKQADKPQEWQVPSKSSVAAFVYGPAGLNRKKVKVFLSKDEDLVAQLADYAAKTAQTEALLQALSSDSSSGQTVDAAFRGFASQYGAATQLDRTQPTGQQMTLALRTLNPAVASYDPISPQSAQRVSQTASLATSVAALFFGSPVGLAAGGTAMLLEVHSLVFPNTVFRSSFAQPLPGDGLGLCGGREPVRSHTKVAYLWATRVPNVGPPHLQVQKPVSLAVGLKGSLPIEVHPEPDWKYLDRARSWALEPDNVSGKNIPVTVRETATPKELEIDLSKTVVPPGHYHLVAGWDWENFAVNGAVTVAPLAEFETARLQPSSQDRLITKTGKVPVTLEGSDFEFVTKVELVKPGDKFFGAEALPFVLPNGFRQGSQSRLDIQINTAELEPGDYRLTLEQPGGKPHPVPISILPAAPLIENFPILANLGEQTFAFTLKGTRLNLIGSMKSEGADLLLEPPSSDGTERLLKVRLNTDPARGQSFDVRAFMEQRSSPLEFPHALQIIGPRAKITDSRVSHPPSVDVALQPGELPSGFLLSALLRVANLPTGGTLALQCTGDDQSRQVLKVGVKTGPSTVERLGPEELFLTFDDGMFPNGCNLMVQTADRVANLDGPGYSLGRIVRVPKIETVQPADQPAGSTLFEATVTGESLETIDRAGWDPDHGTPIAELPTPLPNSGGKQSLRISIPSPPISSDSALYVWLRGESTGRASTAKLQPVGKLHPLASSQPK